FAQNAAFAIAVAALGVCALFLPSSLSEWDWNGVVQWLFTLFLWCALTFCVYKLARHRKAYSIPAIIAVILVTVSTYKLLQLGEVVWAKALGATDEDINWS